MSEITVSLATTPRQLPDGTALPELFNQCTVNLVVGGGGAGTTQILLSHIERYLTKPTHQFLTRPMSTFNGPVQCGAIIYKLGKDAYMRDIRALGLTALADAQAFPIVEWRKTCDVVTGLLEQHKQLTVLAGGRAPQLLVIEGLQTIMNTGVSTKQSDVAEYFEQLRKFMAATGCTIIAPVSMAKMRQSDRLINDRETPQGSVEWGEQSDIVILVEPVDSKLPAAKRRKARYLSISNQAGFLEDCYVAPDARGQWSVVDGEQFNTARRKLTGPDRLNELLAALPIGTEKLKDGWESWAKVEGGVEFDSFRGWWLDVKQKGWLTPIGNLRSAHRKTAAAPMQTNIDDLALGDLGDWSGEIHTI